jgi:hypothetical protein
MMLDPGKFIVSFNPSKMKTVNPKSRARGPKLIHLIQELVYAALHPVTVAVQVSLRTL